MVPADATVADDADLASSALRSLASGAGYAATAHPGRAAPRNVCRRCLSRIAPRGAPGRLGLSFPELNVRTYVTRENKPGIWFFSLDAASLLAVIGARATYHLPYYWADIEIRQEGQELVYRSRRRRRGPAAGRFVGRYQPAGPVFTSEPASLERWLTARYSLYAADHAGRVYRGEINHDPWPLQPAGAEIAVNTMARAHGIALEGTPLLHYASRVDMVAWWPERVA